MVSKFIKSIKNSFSFLTVLRSKDYGSFDPQVGTSSFTVVGLFIGVVLALIAYLIGAHAGAFMLLFCIFITGGLHLDGLSDTFDGLLSHRDKDTMLTIMRDSRVGAMGVISLSLCLIIKFYAFTVIAKFLSTATSLSSHVGVVNINKINMTTSLLISLTAMLILIPAYSRFASVVQFSTLPSVRSEGLGKMFENSNGLKCKLAQFIPLPIATLIFCTLAQAILFNLFYILIVYIQISWIKSKLNGFTGDTLGATIEMTETLLLLSTLFILGI